MFENVRTIYSQGKPVREYTLTAQEMNAINSAISNYVEDLGIKYLRYLAEKLNKLSIPRQDNLYPRILFKQQIYEDTKELSRQLALLEKSPFSFANTNQFPEDQLYTIIDPSTQYFDLDTFLKCIESIKNNNNSRIEDLTRYRTWRAIRQNIASLQYPIDTKYPLLEYEALYVFNYRGLGAFLCLSVCITLPYIIHFCLKLQDAHFSKELFLGVVLAAIVLLYVGAAYGNHYLSSYLAAVEVDHLVQELSPVISQYNQRISPRLFVNSLKEEEYQPLAIFSKEKENQLKPGNSESLTAHGIFAKTPQANTVNNVHSNFTPM